MVGGSELTTILTPEGRSLSLQHFVGWGGPSVVQLMKRTMEILGTELTGRRVLEIGYGHGEMSSFFALLGAHVVAVDTHDVALPGAIAEATRWGVRDRIEFVVYSGDPREIRQADFDIAFSKSVLLLIPQLETFLRAISAKLRPDGQVAFIENGFHNPLAVLGRRIIHLLRRNQANDYPGVSMYSWRLPVYLSPARIDTIRNVFEVREVRRVESPHWYLIHGLKKTANKLP